MHTKGTEFVSDDQMSCLIYMNEAWLIDRKILKH